MPGPQHDRSRPQYETGEGCFLREANREARSPQHRQPAVFQCTSPSCVLCRKSVTTACCTSLCMSKPVTWSSASSRASGDSRRSYPVWASDSIRPDLVASHRLGQGRLCVRHRRRLEDAGDSQRSSITRNCMILGARKGPQPRASTAAIHVSTFRIITVRARITSWETEVLRSHRGPSRSRRTM